MPAQAVSSAPFPAAARGLSHDDAAPRAAPSEPLYVYGVIASATGAPDLASIDGQPLRMVTHGHLAAIVSELPASRLRLDPEQPAVHERVLRRAMERGSVLPLRFGVIMPDAGTVSGALLALNEPQLTSQLSRLKGKVELRLRAIYQESALMHEAMGRNPEIGSLRRSLVVMGEQAGRSARLRLVQLVARTVGQIRERDAREILSRLSPLAGLTLTSEPSLESMALNACFLLDAAEVTRFVRAVDQIRRAQAERLRLHLSGPLPPYSFAELGRAGDAASCESCGGRP